MSPATLSSASPAGPASVSVRVARVIQAAPELIWDSLTLPGRLRDWFCDYARIDARKGGLLQAGWNSGYHAEGTLAVFAPPRTLAFSWLGTGEPAPTAIRVSLAPVAGGARVTV